MDTYNPARQKALDLLSRRSYTKKELCQKLCEKNFPRETVEAVVVRLEEVGLLDDAAYAARKARDLAAYKRWPRRRIALELSRRGVDGERISAAVEDLDDRAQAAAFLAAHRYDTREKAAQAMARYGFAWDDIRAVLDADGRWRKT